MQRSTEGQPPCLSELQESRDEEERTGRPVHTIVRRCSDQCPQNGVAGMLADPLNAERLKQLYNSGRLTNCPNRPSTG